MHLAKAAIIREKIICEKTLTPPEILKPQHVKLPAQLPCRLKLFRRVKCWQRNQAGNSFTIAGYSME